MTNFQRMTLLTAILLVILTTVLVPWQYTWQSQQISQVVKPAGYHLIFTPPAPEFDHPSSGVKVNFKMYLIQLFGIIIVFGGVHILLRSKT